MATSEDTAGSTASSPRWTHWWLAARPRTLTASLVPIAVGLALAPPGDGASAAIALCTVLSALCIQVGVNFANDCFDAEAGIDTADRLGPLRAVQAGLVSASEMRRAFVAVLGLACLFALPLVWRGGVVIVAIGLVSMLCAWAYAGGPRPLASLGLGDLFVFVFFGLVPVAGTVFLQRVDLAPDLLAGEIGRALFVSIPVALLAVAILVVNNLRDIPTDSIAGKRTLAVRLGDRATRKQYAACVLLAMAWPLALPVAFPALGPGPLLALLALPLAVRSIGEVRVRTGSALNASLGATARLQLIHGLLLGAGILATTVSG